MNDIYSMMKAVNCEKWPEEWNKYFDKAKKLYNEQGCIYAEASFYEKLDRKYNNMLNGFCHVYQQAADAVKGDEAFELFLVFMSVVLNESTDLRHEISEFIQPVSPEKINDIKYDMLTGLAICSQAELSYKKMVSRNYSKDIIESVLKLPTNGLKGFMLRHNGAYGYNLLGWFQRAIDGDLIPFGKLQIELSVSFYADAVVLKNSNGDVIALSTEQTVHSSGHPLGARFLEVDDNAWVAEYIETATEFIGYPYDEKGLIKQERIALDKQEWKTVLKKGDPVVALHVPADASLKKEDVDNFFALIKEFLADKKFNAITIGSWLMDPQLEDILNENSNILSFQRRFKKISVKSRGNSVFTFVFKKPDLNFEMKDLPEETSLQRKIKEMYLNNKAIYEVIGYIV